MRSSPDGSEVIGEGFNWCDSGDKGGNSNSQQFLIVGSCSVTILGTDEKDHRWGAIGRGQIDPCCRPGKLGVEICR